MRSALRMVKACDVTARDEQRDFQLHDVIWCWVLFEKRIKLLSHLKFLEAVTFLITILNDVRHEHFSGFHFTSAKKVSNTAVNYACMRHGGDRLQVMTLHAANNGRNSILERLSTSLINYDLATALSFEVCAL